MGQWRTTVPVPGRQPWNMMCRIALRYAVTQCCVLHILYIIYHLFHTYLFYIYIHFVLLSLFFLSFFLSLFLSFFLSFFLFLLPHICLVSVNQTLNVSLNRAVCMCVYVYSRKEFLFYSTTLLFYFFKLITPYVFEIGVSIVVSDR